jgi:hypothetical protein
LHVDPTLPPALDHLFQRMMAKRPEDRPRSLHEVDGTLATISTMAGWDAFASLLTRLGSDALRVDRAGAERRRLR